MKKIIYSLFIVLLVAFVLSSGCVSYNPEDKIYADYMPYGYYYFVDDDGKSFYETLWEDDMGEYINQLPSLHDWMQYIQYVMDYEGDGHDGIDEHFSNISETISKNKGDCEDRAILMARVLYEYGYDSCVIVTKYHVLAGIKKSQYEYNIGAWYQERWGLYEIDDEIEDYYIIECTAPYAVKYYDEPEVGVEKIYELTHPIKNN